MNYIANTERYSLMKYNKCGESGLKLSAVSLGLWHNFGDNATFENMCKMCFTAFDNGITHFDLANNYGPAAGAAERNFGRILKEHMYSYRDQMIISSKAGYYMWEGPYGDFGSRKYLMASIDQSLKRLGLDYVDIFYHHRMDKDTPLEETMGALNSIVKSGKALYAGISNYPREAAEFAYRYLREHDTPCLLHQLKYNILHREPEDEGLLAQADNNGSGFIVYSPLAQGVLTDRYLNGIPADSRAAKDFSLKKDSITPDMIDALKELNKIAEERGQSLAQMALAWVLKDRRVTSVIVGSSSVEQLKTNMQSIRNTVFSDEEIRLIDQLTR